MSVRHHPVRTDPVEPPIVSPGAVSRCSADQPAAAAATANRNRPLPVDQLPTTAVPGDVALVAG